MSKKILVRNTRNGVSEEMTEDQWKELKANPRYNGVFASDADNIKEPVEVAELKAKKSKSEKTAEEPEAEKDGNGK